MKAFVTGWFEIPLASLSERKVNRIKKTLTVTPRAFEGRTPQPIKQYKIRKGRLCVPVEWGIQNFPQAKVVDRTAKAARVKYKRKPSPNHPNAPKGQGRFMEDAKQAVLDNFAALAIAPTGKGKTVVALWLAAVLGVRVLVIVPTSEIMGHWLKDAEEHLGTKPGIVRGPKCQHKGSKVVVGLIHSLAKRDYGPDFYNHFGLVVWDEVHVVGAQTFSKTLGLFNAQYKLGLTATARRKDGAEALFFNYFGPGYARQKDRALPATCYTVNFKHTTKLPNKLAILVNLLARNKERNAFLCRWLNWLFKRDRQILGLSDRIEQLEAVRDMLIKEHGIPANCIGIVANQKTVGMTEAFKPTKKVMRGKRYFVDVYSMGWVEVRVTMKLPKESLVVPVDTPDAKEVTVPNTALHTRHMVAVRKPMKEDELREAKTRQIILATYGKFSMGANVPRLDAGMDLTPRATGEQQIGRVRRFLPDKPESLWITPIDVGISLCEAFAEARLKEYRQCNVKVTSYAKAKSNHRRA